MTTAKPPRNRSTTNRTPAARPQAAGTRHTARSTRSRSATGSRRPTRTTRTTRTRRRRPANAWTIGAALGMLAVTSLLGASWAVRLGLVLLVVVLGVGYLLWQHRGEISAAADESAPAPNAPPAPITPDHTQGTPKL